MPGWLSAQARTLEVSSKTTNFRGALNVNFDRANFNVIDRFGGITLFAEFVSAASLGETLRRFFSTAGKERLISATY
jgi:hypothetical protein